MKVSRKLWTVFVLVALVGVPLSAAPGDGTDGPYIGRAIDFDISPPLAELARMGPSSKAAGRSRAIPNKQLPGVNRAARVVPDPLVQTQDVGEIDVAVTPAPSSNFEGLSDDDNAAVINGRIVPPDTEGDVGLDHYVQMINLIFAVYDKATGNMVAGPFPGNTVWNGSNDICDTSNHGDPVVLYDHLADRWVFSQFALVINNAGLVSDSFECVAVSQTSDPTGPYFRYTFHVSPRQFDDYPKLSVWNNSYFMTANEFGKTSFRGAIAVGFDRAAMLAGNPGAQFVRFGPLACGSICFFSLQPAHLEGPAPAAGTPNTFIMAFDDQTWGSGANPDGYELWNFSVDWSNPGAATFTSLGRVTTADFSSNLCGFGACAEQPPPGELLDTLSQFTMFRSQYRSFPTHASIVVNHTVNVGSDRSGVRWAEIRSTDNGASWSLHQAGTYAPADGNHRFMGSIAMDGSGNIGLSYALSGTSTFPSVAYTSRTPGDPLGTMPGGEVILVAGSDVQVDSFNRYGDYSSISVDPSDDCTFWLTQEYQVNDDDRQDFDFKTRIGAFTIPTCSPPTCGDGICNGTETSCDCPQDCGPAPLSEVGLCTDGIDNDCDDLIDCDDPDCASDPACDCADVGEPCGNDGDCCNMNCSNGPPSSRVCQ